MRTAFDELIEDGRKEGIAEGRAEGLAEGFAEGIIKCGRRHQYSNEEILEDIMAETGTDYRNAQKLLEKFSKRKIAPHF